MGIKTYTTLSFLFATVFTFCQGIEIQRKYLVENPIEFQKFLMENAALNDYYTYHHADYVYYDLYFDTPEFDLMNNGLSLRMRKKNEGTPEFTYVFQLKSEMETAQGLRMEVEEPELDFYMLHYKMSELNLAQLLDTIFYKFENNSSGEFNFEYEFTALNYWIYYKAEGPITPFQKLSFLFPHLFNAEKIASLKPIIIGKSKRIRNHIYFENRNSSTQFGTQLTKTIINENTPLFFIENPETHWLMESSLDSAVFYPLFPSDKSHLTIFEFELENKYKEDSLGSWMMNTFEILLQQKFNIVNTINSKYLQSAIAFRGIK